MRIALVSGDIVAQKITGPRNSLSWLSRSIRSTGEKADVYSTSPSAPFVYNDHVIYKTSQARWDTYDAVVINGIFHPALAKVMITCRMRSIPLLLSPRGSLMRSSMTRKKMAYLRVLQPILRDVPIHFLSEDEQRNSVVHPRRCVVVPNGVNPQFYGLPLARTQHRQGARRFGFMGRLDVRHKGLDLLLKAASRLACAWPPVEFLLCGPQNAAFAEVYKEWRRTSDDERGIVRVFPPAATFKDVSAFFSQIDYFVHPSRYEGLPQACMEAMAAGVPIVVSEACNLAPFLPSYDTALIHTPTCDGAYSSYRYASRMKFSERAFLAAKVRASARHSFDWTAIARRYLQCIEEIVLHAQSR